MVWGSEFGRTPGQQGSNGRGHHNFGFSIWMAGGGIKRGHVYGGTDDIGYRAVENRVSVADWHATILNQLGLHHHDLYFDRNGLKERLTGVEEPRVVKEILA